MVRIAGWTTKFLTRYWSPDGARDPVLFYDTRGSRQLGGDKRGVVSCTDDTVSADNVLTVLTFLNTLSQPFLVGH